ncbi:MAG TPA: hypothetical protein PKA55_15295 [Rhodoblastus sp.]|nr:hypothetical protein [Rhodoblastus sp.]
MLPVIEAWPEEDQEALAEAAREIAAMRAVSYRPSAEELAGIDRGLADVAAGRFARTEDIAAIRRKFRGE